MTGVQTCALPIRCAELLREGKTAARFHPLSRPEEVETEAVNRLIVTADLAGAPVYVVHVSSAASMRRIVEAKTRGQRVYAETCPQYLYLDESLYTREVFSFTEAELISGIRAQCGRLLGSLD